MGACSLNFVADFLVESRSCWRGLFVGFLGFRVVSKGFSRILLLECKRKSLWKKGVRACAPRSPFKGDRMCRFVELSPALLARRSMGENKAGYAGYQSTASMRRHQGVEPRLLRAQPPLRRLGRTHQGDFNPRSPGALLNVSFFFMSVF